MYDFDFHPSGLTFIIMELGQQNLEKALSSRAPLTSIERKALWRQLVDIAITLYNNLIVIILFYLISFFFLSLSFRCISI